ncbi:glycoside hydrolase family 79 protein [Mycena maculata]|uniref:Glycoside hydrolase family 79 protein n=1 Tax=Mycena maculata TaxID=230809 RepID=A0AAD7J6J3_9AGAR|nr:glycoside hydrolase family 79 protein [Mycena maculata]
MWRMASTFLRLQVVGSLCCLALVQGSITVYSQEPFVEGTATGTANVVSYTGAAAYDPTVLIPPAIPDPPPAMEFSQQLRGAPIPGLSVPQSGYFFGFSIEFSVINQIPSRIVGINGSFLQVPFLNLMSNLQARGGSVRVRIGGNTQETATMVPDLPDGKMMEKDNAPNDPMYTPPLLYTPEVVYMLGNISSLVNVQWYLGIPLNDTSNLRLQIAEVAEPFLGDRLLGFQVGNNIFEEPNIQEPDQYGIHGLRPMTYGPANYTSDFGVVDAALRADPAISVVDKKLIGPSISGDWKLEDVWNTGFLDLYQNSLAALSVEYYPENNCAKILHTSNITVDPQQIFSNYLNHTAATSIVTKYLNSTTIAQEYDLPFVMFETNTASCGGFPGVSDSFGSALWALDYGLQLAACNFTGALLHVGGQDVYYNPFTPPPTNQSTYHSWTIGPVYYSALIVAEVFGTSNQSRIIDLQMNNNNTFTPGYAIYDGNLLSRLALINFISDPTGASDYTATISVDSGIPTQVTVKYLVAPSVSSKQNITWAGQTFGSNFASDGRLTGNLNIQTIPCNVSTNICQIRVPAPGFALVFLQETPADAESAIPATWPTTAYTRTINTLSVSPSQLAISNGHWGMDQVEGSTSPAKKFWLQQIDQWKRNGAIGSRGDGTRSFLIACVGTIMLFGLGI